VHELLARRGELEATRALGRERFAAGLAAYRARDWDAAQRSFEAAADLDAEDTAAAVFLERLALLRAHPPARDWDGVFELTAK
jgi:adenylate cyclase